MKQSELRILNYLTLVPTGSGFVSEIARNTGVSKGEVSKSVKELKKSGLVRTEIQGRHTVCIIDRNSAVTMKLRAAFNLLEIIPGLTALQKDCDKIVLFGSCALGTDTLESDIDIFVVTQKKDAVNKKAAQIRFSRPVQWVIKTPQEYIILNSTEKPFAEEVSQGTVLWESHEVSGI